MKNITKLNPKISIFLLIILITFPKIDLIAIPGYWQGIRIEDCIILLFLIFFLSNLNYILLNFRINSFQYKNFYYFFLYLFLSNIVGLVSGLDIKLIMVIRLAEYIFYLFLLDSLNISKRFTINLLFLFTVLNLIVGILQLNDLVGSISSLGFLGPDHEINSRVLGLMGGSWELSIFTTLSYIFIFKNEKSKLKILIMFCISAFLVIVSESKTQTITFGLVNILLLIQSRNFTILIPFLCLSLLTLIFIDLPIINKIKNLNLEYLFNLSYESFVNEKIHILSDVKDQNLHLSYVYRLNFWVTLLKEYQTSSLTILFGTGFTRVYVESLIIRIIFSTGLIGLIFLIYLLRKSNPLYIIIFFVSGLTLDLFISLKIYLITLIILKNNFNEEKNSYRRH
jgi:hypothetical protein